MGAMLDSAMPSDHANNVYKYRDSSDGKRYSREEFPELRRSLLVRQGLYRSLTATRWYIFYAATAYMFFLVVTNRAYHTATIQPASSKTVSATASTSVGEQPSPTESHNHSNRTRNGSSHLHPSPLARTSAASVFYETGWFSPRQGNSILGVRKRQQNENVTASSGNNEGAANNTSGIKRNKNYESNTNRNRNNNYVKTAVYGWTPDLYPNPLTSSVQCGIAYLSTEVQQQQPTEPLRLCDPDWVLGGIYLEQVAVAIKDFSQIFSASSSSAVPGEEQDDKNVTAAAAAEESTAVVHGVGDDGSDVVYYTSDLPSAQLAIAVVRKMNLPVVLRQGTYYPYEDEDDMVQDAAQIFTSRLHEDWWRGTGEENEQNSILIFMSIQDRMSFIVTGSGVANILPWWRLDHIASNMKPAIRHGQYGLALVTAIADLQNLLLSGPPSFEDRLQDFLSRFGVVLGFAVVTFAFGAWGEYRDRWKRFEHAEQQSKMNDLEREKARQLQKEYNAKTCPICLEEFDQSFATEEKIEKASDCERKQPVPSSVLPEKPLKRVDTYGIPLTGADDKPIKLLRCGHVFCETCWKTWLHSGCGNPCKCPVCRQDIGGAKSPAIRRQQRQRQERHQRNQGSGNIITRSRENYGNSNDPSSNLDEETSTTNAGDVQPIGSYGTLNGRHHRSHPRPLLGSRPGYFLAPIIVAWPSTSVTGDANTRRSQRQRLTSDVDDSEDDEGDHSTQPTESSPLLTDAINDNRGRRIEIGDYFLDEDFLL